MAVNNKRVFYVEPHLPRGFAEMLGKHPDIRLDRLEQHGDDAADAPILAAAHAYQASSTRQELVRKFHITADLLKRTPNLLIVSTAGAGYDTVDVKACTAAGVAVVNQTGGNKEAVAEHVLGMMLCLSKRIIETDRYMRRQSGIPRNSFMGHDLIGRTVGIVGLGNVGARVAELCGGLFRMPVIAHDPYLSEAEIAARGATKVDLDELLRRADFVSINCPHNEETRGMIGTREYALMQPHAYFITTARGGIHDEMALAEALTAKTIAGAGLDVWEEEPPPHEHPLMAFDNVLISPHTAGVTHEARALMAQYAAEQIIDALAGARPPRLINPDVWPAYSERFARTFGFAPA